MSRAGTQKQMEILKFIEKFQDENGYSPTVREIGAAVGLASTSTVHSHLRKLTEQGYLLRDGRKSRVMQVVTDQKTNTSSNNSEMTDTISIQEPVAADNAFLLQHRIDNIPVVGDVTAGIPILAQENIEDAFPLPMDFVRGDSSDTFILNVRGDSMINAGILNGDYVVVHSQHTARNGEIVVAMIDGEATVKRFYRESDHIRLQPENDYYEPICSRDVQVLGRVVALLRRM